MSAAELKEIQSVLFPPGSRGGWNDAWQVQGFEFCHCAALPYGLVQPEGGPCGVVAPVQATLIKRLLHSGKSPASASLEECTAQLAAAFAEILWRAGGGVAATVALPSRGVNHTVYRFTSHADLEGFLSAKVRALQLPGGCIALVYSAILSRSTATIRADMDEVDRRLMGAHA
jgi:hypothetical protein